MEHSGVYCVLAYLATVAILSTIVVLRRVRRPTITKDWSNEGKD